MKLEHRIIAYLVFAFIVLGISNIILWKDRQEVWQHLQTQAVILHSLLSEKSFIYEDELPDSLNNKPEKTFTSF